MLRIALLSCVSFFTALSAWALDPTLFFRDATLIQEPVEFSDSDEKKVLKTADGVEYEFIEGRSQENSQRVVLGILSEMFQFPADRYYPVALRVKTQSGEEKTVWGALKKEMNLERAGNLSPKDSVRSKYIYQYLEYITGSRETLLQTSEFLEAELSNRKLVRQRLNRDMKEIQAWTKENRNDFKDLLSLFIGKSLTEADLEKIYVRQKAFEKKEGFAKKRHPSLRLPSLEGDLNTVESLWKSYFFPGALPEIETSLEKKLETTERGRKGNAVYFALGNSLDHQGSSKVEQYNLNPKNLETLIVLSSRDREARGIKELAKKSGAHVFFVSSESLRGSIHFEDSVVKQVENYIKDQGLKISRLLVSETMPLGDMEEVKKRNAWETLHFIDHHAESGAGNRELDLRNYYSSIEQVATALGSSLTINELIIGVQDSSSAEGLRRMGWERDDLPKNLLPRELKDAQALEASAFINGTPVYLINNDDSDLVLKSTVFARALQFKHYNDEAMVLIAGPKRLTYIGSEKGFRILEKLLSESEGSFSVKRAYSNSPQFDSGLMGLIFETNSEAADFHEAVLEAFQKQASGPIKIHSLSNSEETRKYGALLRACSKKRGY